MKRNMKILLLFAAMIVVLAATYFYFWPGSSFDKKLSLSSESKRDQLTAWLDGKSGSYLSANVVSTYPRFIFIGDHEIPIDFDRKKYGLSADAIARVAVDDEGHPMSVIFIDRSLCGIAVAIRPGKTEKDTFGNVPSGIEMAGPRIGIFCIERD